MFWPETGTLVSHDLDLDWLALAKISMLMTGLTCTGRPGRLIGSFGYICRILGLKTGPDGSRQPSGFICTKFQAKPSILDPFRTKFDVFGSDWNFGQPGFGLGLALGKSR